MESIVETVLVVVQPFSSHAVGDLITDDQLAREIVGGEHARNVVRIALEDSSPERPAGSSRSDVLTHA